MCRPPTFRRPRTPADLLTSSYHNSQPSEKPRLPAFRELFQNSQTHTQNLKSRQPRPALSINTQICRENSFITIPITSDDEEYTENPLKTPPPPYEPAIAVNHAYLRRSSPASEPEKSPLTTIENRSEFAEHLVDTSVALIESIWHNANPSNHSIPPLRTFVQEFLRRSHCSFSNLQLALLYLVRFKNRLQEQGINLNPNATSIFDVKEKKHQTPIEIKRFAEIYESGSHESFQSVDLIHPALRCGRRMFLSSLIVACKYLNDKPPSNLAWSQLAGLSLEEINTNERIFLAAISFDLYVIHDVYVKWTRLLLQVLHTVSSNSLPALDTDNRSQTKSSSVTSSPTTYINENNSDSSPKPPRASFEIGGDSGESELGSSDSETDYEDYTSPYVLISKCKRYGCYL